MSKERPRGPRSIGLVLGAAVARSSPRPVRELTAIRALRTDGLAQAPCEPPRARSWCPRFVPVDAAVGPGAARPKFAISESVAPNGAPF